jgi:ubiquinone biosynthesis protein COQ9
MDPAPINPAAPFLRYDSSEGDYAMFDVTTPKGRIISAMMRLAAENRWDDVTMLQIADAAGITLNDLRKEFPSKIAILSAFGRSIDDAVIARAPRPQPGQPPRDRIFDVLMTRFAVLAPHKAALKSIMDANPMDLELGRRVMASQAWMLHAAGVPTDGVMGFSRVAGLATVYASVLDTWLKDDDPGLARTMAALDSRLKRGEQAAQMMDDISSGATRAVSGLRDFLRTATQRATSTAEAGDVPPASSGPSV